MADVARLHRPGCRPRRRPPLPARGNTRRTRVLTAFVYDPHLDGDADPGEVVWTWVPYEDDPTQGKDRPVVVIGRDGTDVLVVPLSSRSHEDRPDGAEWIELGSGQWDAAGRISYANIDRVLRIPTNGIRREGAILERSRFDAVLAAVDR